MTMERKPEDGMAGPGVTGGTMPLRPAVLLAVLMVLLGLAGLGVFGGGAPPAQGGGSMDVEPDGNASPGPAVEDIPPAVLEFCGTVAICEAIEVNGRTMMVMRAMTPEEVEEYRARQAAVPTEQ